ncbi:glycosyltransferase, partial [Methanobrevibacter sp. UBA313]|uniref:glycosyltransferase n=1 Tax=Methanobrevibacter sp. UBA313 TaxID=1915477 RepID=UPI0039B82C72
FEALKQLIDEKLIKEDKIQLNFYGDSGNLKEIAEKYDLKSTLNIGGFIPHEEVLEKESKSDILLLISWNNPKEQMFIPGKVYEYLALKKPILSIGYKQGSLKDLITETGIGFHVSSLNDTKEALLKFYNEFNENNIITFKANESIDKFSMKNTASNFAKLLNQI